MLKGDRVQLHPATDRWMMGDRYGTVISSQRDTITVKLNKSGKTMKFTTRMVMPLFPETEEEDCYE